MATIIRNHWQTSPDGVFSQAHVLHAKTTPEGIDLRRFRFHQTGTLQLAEDVPHIISCLQGNLRLKVDQQELTLGPQTHAYIPQGTCLKLNEASEIVVMSGESADQAGGLITLVRNERYVQACANDSSLRQILTDQYLSRRIFLHHDRTMLSRSGAPLSWFRTTMFNVTGLPLNEDGIPVFKMSYNHRTEPNLCYDVRGKARVRMAKHPYRLEGQDWEPWQSIDSETTYYLDEAKNGPEEETQFSESGPRRRRNKHEVDIEGSVTLFCSFDPAPTGAEKHRPGAYSDYGPLREVFDSPRLRALIQAHQAFDPMLDLLSLAEAKGEDVALSHPQLYAQYQKGLLAQQSLEAKLIERLEDTDAARAAIVNEWRC